MYYTLINNSDEQGMAFMIAQSEDEMQYIKQAAEILLYK
jgi:hypothetical protein